MRSVQILINALCLSIGLWMEQIDGSPQELSEHLQNTFSGQTAGSSWKQDLVES